MAVLGGTLLAVGALLAGMQLSAAGASVAPAFVQQVSRHAASVPSVALAPVANVVAGDRLVVEVAVWSNAGATAASVQDTAGNGYVELLHFKAPDDTEMSVWTAPVTAGAGTRPTVTVAATGTAYIGAAVLEYSGLSSVADASVVDQMAHSSGATGSAGGSVSSGATAATGSASELAVGFYADQGFTDSLTAGSGYVSRVNVSQTTDMELVAEDSLVPAGATPSASVVTGAKTTWLMATLVFKAAPSAVAPAATPGAVKPAAKAGSGSAVDNSGTPIINVPSRGGLPINPAGPPIDDRTPPAGKRRPLILNSPLLWASVNVCSPPDHPDTIGVRGSIPGDGHAGERMYMRFRVQYQDPGSGRFVFVAGADSGYVHVGPATVRRRRAGRDFHFQLSRQPPSYRLRGWVDFQWRRHHRVVLRTALATTAPHATGKAGDPRGYTAAACTLGG
jgi:hypothetical protein